MLSNRNQANQTLGKTKEETKRRIRNRISAQMMQRKIKIMHRPYNKKIKSFNLGT